MSRQCATCGGDIEPDREGRSDQCKRCSRKRKPVPQPPPPERIPPLTELGWMTADLLPVYERVCAVYGPGRVGGWLREVYTDPTHPTLALKVDAMALTLTSADEMAPWWQEASRQLPGGSQARVWMLAGKLRHGSGPVIAGHGLEEVLAEPPAIPDREAPEPAGSPAALLRQRDLAPRALVTPLTPPSEPV